MFAIESLSTGEAIVYNARTFERVTPILPSRADADAWLVCLDLTHKIAIEDGLSEMQSEAAAMAFASQPYCEPWGYLTGLSYDVPREGDA